MSSKNLDEDIDNNTVESIIKRLEQLRKDRQVKEADQLRTLLLNEHAVQVFYRRDGTIGWSKIRPNNTNEGQLPVKKIGWSLLDNVTPLHSLCTVEPVNCKAREDVPLIIATVNTPHYRTRLAETMDTLSKISFNDGTRFTPKAIDMLNLSDHKSIGVHRILLEGWRRILLPTLLNGEGTKDDESIVFIAEDDLRLGTVSPGKIRDVCSEVMKANPDIQILSLGHSYAAPKPSRRQRRRAKRELQHNNRLSSSVSSSYSLLQHVTNGKGIHATTFLAIRHPTGTKSLLDAMEDVPMGKRCHFDTFLFHSTLHNVGIVFSDPPLVGWGEVTETLTSVGSGCCRNRGGRLAQVPNVVCNDIKWVRRIV